MDWIFFQENQLMRSMVWISIPVVQGLDETMGVILYVHVHNASSING